MEPLRLPARNGWEWIKQGFALFMKAPLLWIVLLFICLITALAISSVPIVGQPLMSLLMPAILVGLMAGCRALGQGEELELAHLLRGFKRHTSQLVTLGGIALARPVPDTRIDDGGWRSHAGRYSDGRSA
jgi:hypothetical protein